MAATTAVMGEDDSGRGRGDGGESSGRKTRKESKWWREGERGEESSSPGAREASLPLPPPQPAMTDTNKRSGDFAQAPPATTTTTTTLSSTSRSFAEEIEIGRIGGFAEATRGPTTTWVEPAG